MEFEQEDRKLRLYYGGKWGLTKLLPNHETAISLSKK
jgi:hypothetical protein